MPRNHFRENRIRIQDAVLDFDFLTPLTSKDIPYTIVENNANEGNLREVIIVDIPTEEAPRPKSWILDLEIEEPALFSQPPKIKTVEKALIVLGCDELTVFLFEMKSSLQPDGDGGVVGIRKKIEDSIGRISLLLPLYIFGKDYNDYKIQYKGIIFYNNDDSLINAIHNRPEITNGSFIKAFQERRKKVFLDDPINGNHGVELFFFQNSDLPDERERFTINYEKFFFEEWQHSSSIFGDMTLPVIKNLPTE